MSGEQVENQLDDKYNALEANDIMLLFQLTKKLLLTSQSNEVLEELIDAFLLFYPQANVQLLLTHEDKKYRDLPVAYFERNTQFENEVAFRTYQTGIIQIEKRSNNQILHIPFKGVQAMYGVLQLSVTNSKEITEKDFEILQHLADVSGNAFEKARLQEQLNQRINDLNLLNDSSHKLNSNLRLTDTVEYMTEQIQASIHSEQVGFFFFNRTGEIEALQGSTEYFFTDASSLLVEKISEKIKQRKEAFMMLDLMKENIQTPYRSLLAVPMIHDDELKGATIVLHTRANFFTFDQFKLLESLIYHSTLAFINSMLHEEMQRLAITDQLTRLYSRNYLDEKINESMQSDMKGTFILFDIDDFKQVNDTYGHLTGDDVIIQVSNLILANKRSTDIAARWGGEELALYLPAVDITQGLRAAERLVSVVKKSTSPSVTLSGGIAYWDMTDSNDTVTKLFNRADQALYEAKRAGKNQVVVQPMYTN